MSFWNPTHIVVVTYPDRTERIPVQVIDGRGYTREDHAAWGRASWTQDEDGRIAVSAGALSVSVVLAGN